MASDDDLFASSDEEDKQHQDNAVNYDDDNENDNDNDYDQQNDDAAVEEEEEQQPQQPLQQQQQPQEEEEEDMAALFDDGEDDNEQPPPRDEGMSDDNQEREQSDGERSEDEEPVKPKQVYAPPIDIAAPLVPLPPSSETYLMKTSNVVDFEPRPFDPEAFQIEEESYEDEQGIKRIRPRDQNVVRWRWKKGPDGSMERESNARFIKWSDGTWQLQLGDEILDVANMDMSKDQAYLYVLHGGTLQGQAHLTAKLQCRPSSLDSRSHKRLRDMVGKRHSKVYRVGQHVAWVDPEKDKANKERVAQDQIKARETQQRKQERVAAQYTRPAQQSRMTIEDLEQGDDEDILGYDNPEPAPHLRRTYDDEGEGARKLVAAQHGSLSQHKRGRAAQDDADSEDEGDDGDDFDYEEEDAARKKSRPAFGYNSQEREKPKEKEKPKDQHKPKAKRGVVISSDDDE